MRELLLAFGIKLFCKYSLSLPWLILWWWVLVGGYHLVESKACPSLGSGHFKDLQSKGPSFVAQSTNLADRPELYSLCWFGPCRLVKAAACGRQMCDLLISLDRTICNDNYRREHAMPITMDGGSREGWSPGWGLIQHTLCHTAPVIAKTQISLLLLLDLLLSLLVSARITPPVGPDCGRARRGSSSSSSRPPTPGWRAPTPYKQS